MNVLLDEEVLAQAMRYNIPLQVPFLAITNGSHCYAFENKGGQLVELAEFPSP